MRGYLASEYLDDGGTPWKLLVDADYAQDPARGWTTGAIPGLPPFPRLWIPRRVVGIDETGRRVETRVASVDAPLWTGEVLSFWVHASDGGLYNATVIRKIRERHRF